MRLRRKLASRQKSGSQPAGFLAGDYLAKTAAGESSFKGGRLELRREGYKLSSYKGDEEIGKLR